MPQNQQSNLPFVTRAEFNLYKDEVNRRLKKIEYSHEGMSSAISDVKTDTKLILQKLQQIQDDSTQSAKEADEKVKDVEKRISKVAMDLNEHVNINPRKEYEALTKKIIWLFISTVICSFLASVAIIK